MLLSNVRHLNNWNSFSFSLCHVTININKYFYTFTFCRVICEKIGWGGIFIFYLHPHAHNVNLPVGNELWYFILLPLADYFWDFFSNMHYVTFTWICLRVIVECLKELMQKCHIKVSSLPIFQWALGYKSSHSSQVKLLL